MLETLCKLVQSNYGYLTLSLSYTKSCDWAVTVEQKAEIGQAKPIVSVQDKDLTLSCAEAYLKTTEWLRINKGGY